MTVFNSRNSWFKSSIGPVTLEEKSDKSLFAKLCLKICLGNRNVKSAFIVMEQMIGNERKINEIPMKKITINLLAIIPILLHKTFNNPHKILKNLHKILNSLQKILTLIRQNLHLHN